MRRWFDDEARIEEAGVLVEGRDGVNLDERKETQLTYIQTAKGKGDDECEAQSEVSQANSLPSSACTSYKLASWSAAPRPSRHDVEGPFVRRSFICCNFLS